MNCVVFKLDERLHDKLIKFYKNYELEKKPPYSKFAAKNYDVTITLYESGKVMFQGIGADIEASIWQSMQSKITGKPTENTVKNKEKSNENNDFYVYYSSYVFVQFLYSFHYKCLWIWNRHNSTLFIRLRLYYLPNIRIFIE